MPAVRQDEAFLYQKDATDGWLVTIRGDFAEMVHIDPASAKSMYERYEAPIEKIRAAIKTLLNDGFSLAYSLDLNIKPLIEV